MPRDKRDCTDRTCGALDCETCRPGSRDILHCDCGAEPMRHESGECLICGAVVCPECWERNAGRCDVCMEERV